MARIRTIKPEFWTDEKISQVSESSALLALALLNYADDEGYFNANPKLITAFAFPLRETSVSTHDMIKELSNIGYIKTYKSTDGKMIGFITNFEKHQKINRPTSSVLKGLIGDKQPFTESSLSTHEALTAGKEQGTGKGKEEEKSKPKKKTDLVVPIENFELTQEVIEWGETQPMKWTSGEMQLHFDYFVNYLKNRTAKPYKDLAAAFRNAVICNYAKLRQYQHQPNKTRLDVIKERNKAVLEASLLGDEESHEQLQRLD